MVSNYFNLDAIYLWNKNGDWKESEDHQMSWISKIAYSQPKKLPSLISKIDFNIYNGQCIALTSTI